MSTADHDEGAIVPANKIVGDIDFLVSRNTITPYVVGGIQMEAETLPLMGSNRQEESKPKRDEITVEDYFAAVNRINSLETAIKIAKLREDVLREKIAEQEKLLQPPVFSVPPNTLKGLPGTINLAEDTVTPPVEDKPPVEEKPKNKRK